VANKENKPIGITQTGTQFAYVGKLLIKDGRFTTTLVPTTEIPYENARVTATTDSVKTLMNETVNRVIGTSPYPLAVTNEDDIYIVRYMETNAGDLVTDAYRAYTKADIALENGNDSLVLSAFGCGAYGTPPKEMARLFHEVIESKKYKSVFKRIVFAIINLPSTNGDHNPEGNFKPFSDEFTTV
jgi:hypothetical protein